MISRTPFTPISNFESFCAKREDYACWRSLEHPSGAKVRQYLQMASKTPQAQMIVGCAAFSAMQIYVASAAEAANVKAIIYVPARKVRSSATDYAIEHGAEVHYVKPAYMNVIRARAKAHAVTLPQAVRWKPDLALLDTIDQCANIPAEVKRVVVPTGSGLTAAGVMLGLKKYGLRAGVLAVAVSPLATVEKIMELARQHLPEITGKLFKPSKLPDLHLERHQMKYNDHLIVRLPDGTPLDPYYAAKAYAYVTRNDCLWIPGLRPVCSMPETCKTAFKNWKGFHQ